MIDEERIQRLTRLANEITFEKYPSLANHYSEYDIRFICELYDTDKLAVEKLIKTKKLMR